MRLLLKILLFIMVLGLLAAAIVLVPPHLQVRSVEPQLPTATQLQALMAVPNGPVSVRYINTAQQASPGRLLTHSVFLIEWANGNLFMVDAGMDRTAADEFGELLESIADAEPAKYHGAISDLLAEDVQQVTGMGFTHLHIDHTQGVLNFCAARGAGVDVFQTPWQRDLHNFNTEEGAAIVASSCLNRQFLEGEGLVTIPGYPGLGLVGLGGHTPGSTMFAIGTAEKVFLLSGDTTNAKDAINTNTGKGFVYSYLFVPEHTDRTQELRLWLKELDQDPHMTVVVSHDLNDIKTSGIAEHNQ